MAQSKSIDLISESYESSDNPGSVKQLRNALRAKRRNLTAFEQAEASLSLAENLLEVDRFRFRKRIGIYLSNDGEVDLNPLIHWFWQRSADLYLPVLSPVRPGSLWFAPFFPDQNLKTNRFGIPEPVFRPNQLITPQALDMVLTPLVGFDNYGNRMGMGGGYYDRTFAFKKRTNSSVGPLLIGTAHRCQQVPELSTNSWDIPLTAIATDERIIWA